MVLMLPAAGRIAVPWKNGGGRTTEIAVEPPGSDFESFDWRLSTAEVTAAGPFSVFAGIDRELAVLEGSLRLEIEGKGTQTLTRASAPVRFAGDVRAHGEPLAGPVTDLNLMARRGRCRARLERRGFSGPTELALGYGTTLVLAVSALQLEAGAQRLVLGPRDAARLDGEARCTIAPRAGAAADSAGAEFFLVTVSAVS